MSSMPTAIATRPFLRVGPYLLLAFIGLCCEQVDVRAGSANAKALKYRWKSLPVHGGGYIAVVRVDPQNSNVLYAGSDVGGMYKTTDRGRSWRMIDRGLLRDADHAIADILIDPLNSNHIYIATGHVWGRPKGAYGGIFGSHNAGETWQLLSREVRFCGMGTVYQLGRVLAADPEDPRVLYAGTAWDGVFKSTDGGRSWKAIGLTGQYITSLVLVPAEPRVLYVSSGRKQPIGRGADTQPIGGIFKSNDDGATWTKVFDKSVHEIAISKKQPNTIYAACGAEGIFKSDDGGKSWRECLKCRLKKAPQAAPELQYSFVSVAIDPSSPSVVYAASKEYRPPYNSVFKTVDGGLTWRSVPADRRANVHIDDWPWGGKYWFFMSPHAIEIDPSAPRNVYVPDWFQAWHSPDGGDNWYARPRNAEVVCVNDVAPCPRNPHVIWFVDNDVGLWKTADGGKSFVRQRQVGCHLHCIAVNPKNPDVVYAAQGTWGKVENTGALYKSEDGGANWQKLSTGNGLPNTRICSVAIAASRPEIVYAGTERFGIYKSADGGESWNAVNDGLADLTNLVRQVVVDSKNAEVVYAVLRKTA